jgi:hypothetical protein
MITITNTKELPWTPVRAYLVADESEAREIAGTKTAYLFQQTAEALYVFVEI